MKSCAAILLAFLSASTFGYDFNTSGHYQVSQIKAWDDRYDVYFSNGEQHQCNGGHSTRFLLDPNKDHFVSLLLAAYMAGKVVQLAYDCDASGIPWIAGIRVK